MPIKSYLGKTFEGGRLDPPGIGRVKKFYGDCPLTLPVPSLLVPTPDTRGVGRSPPAISKTLGPMNLKFCRVSETSLNVLEI